MEKSKNTKFDIKKLIIPLCIVLVVLAGIYINSSQNNDSDDSYRASSFAMNTVITQTTYGKNAQDAATAVNRKMIEIEQMLSMFDDNSYIAQINAAAGKEYVVVSQEVFDLLKDCVYYSQQSEGAFRVTIGPVTTAWGVTSGEPRVVPQSEIDELLLLVNDEDVLFDEENCAVMLAREGQMIDLGGIAKGWACFAATRIYEEHGVKSAWISIGGNVLVHGEKPSGGAYTVGFRDPSGGAQSYIANVQISDSVFAVSGGYERFFEEDGVSYGHIMNPETGAPAVSDVASVGVVSDNGTYSDFMSTTLFVWGTERTLEFMRSEPDCSVMLLTNDNILYVSENLREGFALANGATCTVEFIS